MRLLLPIVLLLLGLAVIGALVVSRRPPSAASLRARLLRLVHGDAEVLERLVAHERSQSPRISEREALRRALVRLQRDRR